MCCHVLQRQPRLLQRVAVYLQEEKMEYYTQQTEEQGVGVRALALLLSHSRARWIWQ